MPPRWGWDNQVFGWSNDGKRIYLPFAARFVDASDRAALFGFGRRWSSRTHADAYRRFGRLLAQRRRDRLLAAVARFRSEKRYGGGQANQLYIFDLKSNAAKKITEGPRATRDAMWIGDTIFFNSDRDGHFNLYAYNVSNGKTTQVTNNNRGTCAGPVQTTKTRSFTS